MFSSDHLVCSLPSAIADTVVCFACLYTLASTKALLSGKPHRSCRTMST